MIRRILEAQPMLKQQPEIERTPDVLPPDPTPLDAELLHEWVARLFVPRADTFQSPSWPRTEHRQDRVARILLPCGHLCRKLGVQDEVEVVEVVPPAIVEIDAKRLLDRVDEKLDQVVRLRKLAV